jgi:hypothetical protein
LRYHSGILPFKTANNITRSKYTTHEQQSQTVELKSQDLSELGPDVSTILDLIIEPGETEQTTVDIPETTADIDFLGLTATGDPVEISVENVITTARVGAKNAAEQVTVNNVDANQLNVSVTLPESAESPADVQVLSIEIPDRPAVMGVLTDAVLRTDTRNNNYTESIRLTESSNQQPLTGIDLTLPTLDNGDGTTLPAETINIINDIDTLAPGSTNSIDLKVSVSEDLTLDLEEEATRFTGQATVATDNAGEQSVDIGIFLLDSDVETAELIDVVSTVTAVRIEETTVSNPPNIGEIRSVYSITVEGDGSATVQLPDALHRGEIEPFLFVDGEYESVTFGADDEAGSVTVSEGENTIVVVDLPARPPALPGLETAPQDPDGDGLYEDVRGDGNFNILDVQTLFNNLDNPTVQNNAEAFKFQESGTSEEVTVLDVQALFNELQE